MNIRVLSGIFVVVAIVAVSGYMSLAPQGSSTFNGKAISYQAKGTPSMTIGGTVVKKEIAVKAIAKNPTPPAPTSSGSINPQTRPVIVPTPTSSTPTPTPITKPAPVPPPAPTPKPAPAPAPKPLGISASEVMAHADTSSCWSVINGSVYDLTDYISRHPGGSQRIINICGGDGTDAFSGQHSGDFRAESVLANYRLGAFLN